MHVRTTLPSAARAKNLRRQDRIAEAREIEREDDRKHSHEDSDYGAFGYIQDGVRPYSVGSAMELAYHAVWAGSGSLHTPLGASPNTACAPLAPPGPDALPRVLFEHARALLSSHLDDADDVARWTACRPSLVAARLRLDRALVDRTVAGFARMYATLFAPFWVRPPETWTPPAQGDERVRAASLVRHLFARHPTHPALLRAWYEGSEDALKWVCWFVILAQGASLRRAATWFGWHVPKGLSQHLAQAPAALDAAAACRHAEIARRGGDASDLAHLERHRGWVLDPTASSDDMIQAWLRSLQTESKDPEEERLARDEAYIRTQWPFAAAWVVRHREALATAGDAWPLVGWLLHAVTERSRTNDAASLAWAALTPERVRATMTAEQRGATLEAEAIGRSRQVFFAAAGVPSATTTGSGANNKKG